MYDQDISVPDSPDEMLRELEDAIREKPVFLRGGPVSDVVRDAYLADQPDEQQQEVLKEIEHRQRAARRLRKIIWQLGTLRYEPAILALKRIWVDGALAVFHADAGHALFAMQADEARSALELTIDSEDHLCRYLGIRAVFDRAPKLAYERFEPLFATAEPESRELAQNVLWIFCPSGRRRENGRDVFIWNEPRARDWLKDDPRWLDLCAQLRRDPVFGRNAREALRHADPTQRSAALHRARASEPLKDPETRTKRAGDLLGRYRSGEFTSVWEEIRSHRRISGAFHHEIMDVAEETMRRVARNADLLSERLEASGWKSLRGRLRTEPSAADIANIQRVEEITGGPIPPTLLAFWRVVGGIDWIWDYNSDDPPPDLGVDLPIVEMDPLCVDPAGIVDWLFEAWEEQKNQPDTDLVDPFSLELAPDRYFKANYGGGSSYAIELPFLGADPVFANEPHELPFVDYLRLCFQWAGFPGLEKYCDREDVRKFISRFAAGLEPF